MIRWNNSKRYSPIGVDLGSSSVKLLQLDLENRRLVDAVRWDLPDEADSRIRSETIQSASEGRAFRGRDAVLCLTAPALFVQNLRVPKVARDEFDRLVYQEAMTRLPWPLEEAELRYLDVGDVRQGDTLRREVIVLGVHRDVLHEQLEVVSAAGLRPVAVDVAPCALARCFAAYFRRDEDHDRRRVFVQLGASRTMVVVAAGSEVQFVKYLDVGGLQMDEAVSRHLNMDLEDAIAMRRHNGDRRADQRDAEVTRSLRESVRPVVTRLANELSMCVRYHSVTFRGEPLAGLVLSGGEATGSLVELLAERLNLACEVGNPLRDFPADGGVGRASQWDVASGLALRPRS